LVARHRYYHGTNAWFGLNFLMDVPVRSTYPGYLCDRAEDVIDRLINQVQKEVEPRAG
jgi:hypothetical protein